MVKILKDATDCLGKSGLLRFCEKVARKVYRLFRPCFLDMFNRLRNTGDMNALTPVKIFASPGFSPRVNLLSGITSRNDDSESIAITLLIMTAVNRGFEPRIISESALNSARFYKLVMECNAVNLKQITFVECIPGKPNSEIDVDINDIFITTTWQATHSVIQCVDENRVVYLLMEDERKLCADSTSREICSRIYANKNIHFIVVSRKLLDELVADGFDNIAIQGLCFDDTRIDYAFEQSGDALRQLEDIVQNLALNWRMK